MKTFGKTRRDPQKGKNGFSTYRGFTLIELMVVIAIVAIITSFALPSYRTLIEKRQVTSGAQQLGAFFSAVQIESVKRNENIGVKYSRADNDSWCVGMVVVADPTTNTPCDCTAAVSAVNACKIDGQLRVFSGANLNFPGIMNAINGDGAFVYDPVRGLMVDFTDAAELELLSEDASYSLNVQVSATGRVKICNDASASTLVPGFKQCT